MLIRHDVDHDIHSALEMAHIEANYDLTSTYFILHSAEYFEQNLRVTLDICHKIQELGHEIGLHNDLISDYFSNDLHPKNNLKQILKIFRDEEIQINGSASHGSKIIHELINNCHDKSKIEYRNFLVFKEIYDKWVKLDENKIAPLNSKLGNKLLKLPVFEMSEFDLAYEAYFIPYNHYVSDSGGNFWYNSSCPIETVSKSNQGHTIQCLFHPIWWKYDLK